MNIKITSLLCFTINFSFNYSIAGYLFSHFILCVRRSKVLGFIFMKDTKSPSIKMKNFGKQKKLVFERIVYERWKW